MLKRSNKVTNSGRTQIPEKLFHSNLSKAINFMSLCSKISTTQIPVLKTIHNIPTGLSAHKVLSHQQTIIQPFQLSLITFKPHPNFSLLLIALQELRNIHRKRFEFQVFSKYITSNRATDSIFRPRCGTKSASAAWNDTTSLFKAQLKQPPNLASKRLYSVAYHKLKLFFQYVFEWFFWLVLML